MAEDRPPIVDKLRDAIQRQQEQRRKAERFPLPEVKEGAKIVGLCILVAMAYGILQDQVTARVCIEYFTMGHLVRPNPQLPTLLTVLWANIVTWVAATDSPTLLAFFWGVAATWWAGAILGLPLAFICRFGSRPKLGYVDVIKPIAILLVTLALVSFVAGVAGYRAARVGWVWLVGPIASKVPDARHPLYLADLWAHGAAYTVGFVGGLVLWFHAWRRRRGLARIKPDVPLPLSETSRN